MKFSVLTLFPDLIFCCVRSSITGRAIDNNLLTVDAINIRDYALDAYGKVDDSLYGGGRGMLMMCQPIYDAWHEAHLRAPKLTSKTIYMSPKGQVLTQKKAIELSHCEHIILLCGHYEGVDQRVIDEIADEELSIGDYVLTGGELPACIVIDAVARMLDGVLPDQAAIGDESHMNGMLEAAHYTRPESWNNRNVPDVLLSGHHKNISEYRRLDALYRTWQNRPDLLKNILADDWHALLDRKRKEDAI